MPDNQAAPPWSMRTNRPRIFDGARPTPGVNLDRIDVAAGIRELFECGWKDPHTHLVIEHALTRWARGEEAAAERAAIDQGFHGVDLTSWRRVLAAARAGGEASSQVEPTPTHPGPEKAPGPRWTTDRGAMPGEAFARLDGDADTARAAMIEVSAFGRSRFEVRAPGGDLICVGGTPAEAARLAEQRFPPES